jgi:MoxR-like ATPase
MKEIAAGEPISLPQLGTWPESVHIFEQEDADAVLAALAAQRPLLLRGEPGTGKSQLARAAAFALGRMFVSSVVHARSEAQDLQWEFDAVARLGEAQALATAKSDSERKERLDPGRYLVPGPLWWTFDWHSAQAQHQACLRRPEPPETPPGWGPDHGAVLLIDEIDKAEADLPNGLLETLGNGGFPVPYLQRPVRRHPEAPPPLVVITTNEERELPSAFLRRCMVHELKLPAERAELVDWLVRRGEQHFGGQCAEGIAERVAEMLADDREAAFQGERFRPGQAEYLDILRAVLAAADGDAARQDEYVTRLAGYALNKTAEPAL